MPREASALDSVDMKVKNKKGADIRLVERMNGLQLISGVKEGIC